MFEYWHGNYRIHNLDWSQEKATLVLESWMKKFTEVSLILYLFFYKNSYFEIYFLFAEWVIYILIIVFDFIFDHSIVVFITLITTLERVELINISLYKIKC